MDPFDGRVNEEEMLDIIRTSTSKPRGAEEGMEPEHSREHSRTSTSCDDDDDSQTSEQPAPESEKVRIVSFL